MGFTRTCSIGKLPRIDDSCGFDINKDTSHATILNGPICTERRCRAHVVRLALAESLDRMLGGKLGPLVAYAAKQHKLSEDEIARLRQILEKKGGNDG